MNYTKIDQDKLLKKFGEEYDFLYDNNDKVAGYRDALEMFEDELRNNKEFKKLVGDLCKKRGDVFSSDRECVALMFALESLGAFDESIEESFTESNESEIIKIVDDIVDIKHKTESFFNDSGYFVIKIAITDDFYFTDDLEEIGIETEFALKKNGKFLKWANNLDAIIKLIIYIDGNEKKFYSSEL